MSSLAPEPTAAPRPAGGGAPAPSGRPARRGARAPRPAPAPSPGQAQGAHGRRAGDILVAGAGMAVLLLLLAPTSPWVLDVVIVANLAGSVLVLVVSAYTTDPLEFSAFPSVLLLATVARVATNVALARLILLGGSVGSLASAFGVVMMGGNPVVGFVLFVILMIVQFMVISSGSSRIAEVAARFTLDAMPGKQMAIDADLNAGVITDDQARERRRAIEQQADFYGAMDGASKFVRGDAVAGAVIVLVDLVGGIALGAFARGMDLLGAVQTSTTLTVGAALAVQVPALVMSTASGLLVTRAASRQELGVEVARQTTAQPRALAIAGLLVAAVGLIPGMPKLLVLGAAATLVAARTRRGPAPVMRPAVPSMRELGSQRALEELLGVEPVELLLGSALMSLVSHADLQDRIIMARRQVTQQLGIVVPQVRVRDMVTLDPRAYAIHLWGTEAAHGELYPDRLMALPSGQAARPVDGIAGRDPTFGTQVVWIAPAAQQEADRAGYLVVPPSAVIATHLVETLRRHAAELITRQSTRDMVERLRPQHSALLEELIPKVVTLGLVQRVLQGLLAEGVPVRNLARILEVLGDGAQAGTKDPAALVELVRRALGPAVWQPYLDRERRLPVIAIDPGLQEQLRQAHEQTRPLLGLGLRDIGALVDKITASRAQAVSQGASPVLLTVGAIRPALRTLLAPRLPTLPVLAYEELAPDVALAPYGVVGLGSGP